MIRSEPARISTQIRIIVKNEAGQERTLLLFRDNKREVRNKRGATNGIKYRIELGFQTECIEEYARWLEGQGHVVTHGGAEGQRIRGLADPGQEQQQVSALWDAFVAREIGDGT